MAAASGPFCSALGRGDDAEAIIRLGDARERVVCDEHTDDGEVVGDV